MSRPFEVSPLIQAYGRRVLFAIELLDPVTLSRITQDMSEISDSNRSNGDVNTKRVRRGPTVVAEGLERQPIVNAGGCFVWLEENIANLRKISVDPGLLPYERVDREAFEVTLPLTRIELPPLVAYPFPRGITGLRGTLIEKRLTTPQTSQPVPNAEVGLRWLDDNGIWKDSPVSSHTTEKGGDFVSFLRLGPKEKPDIDANGAVTVRLQVRRNGSTRSSTDLKLLQGRITDPSTLNSLTFAWDELQP